MKKIIILLFLLVLIGNLVGCHPITVPTRNTQPAPTSTIVITDSIKTAVGVKIGNSAPDFELKNMENQITTLSSLKGNPVILNFWASWCGPCKHEMPYLQQIYKDWQSEDVILLTINLRETYSVVMQYMQSNNLSFPVLFDNDASVSQEYNVTGIPTTFFIDGDGVIQAKKLGSFSSVFEIESHILKIQL